MTNGHYRYIITINSYAPQSGYVDSKINDRRRNINNHMYNISKNNHILWLIDNNDRISQNENDTMISGPWGNKNIADPGTGGNFINHASITSTDV